MEEHLPNSKWVAKRWFGKQYAAAPCHDEKIQGYWGILRQHIGKKLFGVLKPVVLSGKHLPAQERNCTDTAHRLSWIANGICLSFPKPDCAHHHTADRMASP